MQSAQPRLQELFEKWLSRTATPADTEELMLLMEAHPLQEPLAPALQKAWDEQLITHTFTAQQKDKIVNEIVTHYPAEEERGAARVHRVHFLKTAWFRYAAAVILLLGIGGYILWSDRGEIPLKGRNDKGDVVQSKTTSNNKAILTLADGSQIILDDKANGNIAQQGNTQIIKLDANQLTYNSNIKKTSPPAMEGTVFDPREAGQKPGVGTLYNTITTPRGSQYQVILPDGTKVWLNTASSIKFPTTFAGKERKVEVTGEAYFEVVKNLQQIFTVKVNNQPDIIVIGTSFNVNAYEETRNYKTSLLEGTIKIDNQLLKPGQAYRSGKIIATNINQDIAWKNGIFDFTDQPLAEVMNQLARWYDVEVVYKGELPAVDFYGEISRSLPLSDVLLLLSGMQGVDIRLEGKKIIVSALQR